jgi:hypothetical protein
MSDKTPATTTTAGESFNKPPFESPSKCALDNGKLTYQIYTLRCCCYRGFCGFGPNNNGYYSEFTEKNVSNMHNTAWIALHRFTSINSKWKRNVLTMDSETGVWSIGIPLSDYDMTLTVDGNLMGIAAATNWPASSSDQNYFEGACESNPAYKTNGDSAAVSPPHLPFYGDDSYSEFCGAVNDSSLYFYQDVYNIDGKWDNPLCGETLASSFTVDNVTYPNTGIFWSYNLSGETSVVSYFNSAMADFLTVPLENMEFALGYSQPMQGPVVGNSARVNATYGVFPRETSDSIGTRQVVYGASNVTLFYDALDTGLGISASCCYRLTPAIGAVPGAEFTRRNAWHDYPTSQFYFIFRRVTNSTDTGGGTYYIFHSSGYLKPFDVIGFDGKVHIPFPEQLGSGLVEYNGYHYLQDSYLAVLGQTIAAWKSAYNIKDSECVGFPTS